MKLKTVLALALMALLVAGTLAAFMPSAFAQTSYGTASMIVCLIDINGGQKCYGDSEPILPRAAIIGENFKQVKEIAFKVRVLTPSGADKVTNTLSVSPTLQVLKRDGTYASVAISGSPVVKQGPRVGEWYLYEGKVSISTIESIIGTGPEFKSELRVSTKSTVQFQGTISGKSTIFNTPQLAVKIPVTKSGGTTPIIVDPPSSIGGGSGGSSSDGGNTEAPVIIKPTGKVYHTVGIKYTDGSARTAVSQDVKTLAIIDPNAPNSSGNIVKEITYNMWLVLDQDAFQVAQGLTYADSGATDNYGATVGNNMVAKTVERKIEPFGSGYNYRLMSMTVQADALGGIGTSGVNDHLKFYVKDSTLKITSVQKTFSISIPRQSVDIDLVNLTVTDETGGGEIDGDTFTPATPFNMMYAVAILGIGGIASVAVYAKKRKR